MSVDFETLALEPAETSASFNFRVHFALRRPPVIAFALVLISFLLTLASRQEHLFALSDRFIDWGAKSNAALFESGEWHRLIAANFLHAGWHHFSVNAALLLTFGGLLENLYRREHVLFVLLGSGLSTTVASSLTSDHLALGASGIVLGCLTACAVFGVRHRLLLRRRYRWLLIVVAPALAAVYLAMGAWVAGIDTAGHVGGALFGLLCGQWLDARLLNRRRPALAPVALLGAILALGAATAVGWTQLEWRVVVRPSDDLAVALPETMTLVSQSPSHWAFENELGTSVLVERLEPQPPAQAHAAFEAGDLRRLREAEDIHQVVVLPIETIELGGSPALVLPLLFTGPRGPMSGWHVWLSTPGTSVHGVWTARASRRAQNEALFQAWLSHFSFH